MREERKGKTHHRITRDNTPCHLVTILGTHLIDNIDHAMIDRIESDDSILTKRFKITVHIYSRMSALEH